MQSSKREMNKSCDQDGFNYVSDLALYCVSTQSKPLRLQCTTLSVYIYINDLFEKENGGEVLNTHLFQINLRIEFKVQ